MAARSFALSSSSSALIASLCAIPGRLREGEYGVTANSHRATPRVVRYRQEAPARKRGSFETALTRIPDDGEDIIVLTGSAAKVRIELLGPERRIGEAQADVILPGRFRAFRPTGTDLHAIRDHPVVGLLVGLLVGVGNDADGRPEGERFQMTLVGAVGLAGDLPNRRHDGSPLLFAKDHPSRWRTVMRPLRHPNRHGRSEAQHRKRRTNLCGEERGHARGNLLDAMVSGRAGRSHRFKPTSEGLVVFAMAAEMTAPSCCRV